MRHTAEAYSICPELANKMRKHVGTLTKEYKTLTHLMSTDSVADDFIEPLETVQRAQDWYELESTTVKRLCNAAKRPKDAKKARTQ